MKILLVTQHFYPESFRINDFAQSLVKRGHEVTVLTGLPNYPIGKLWKGYSFLKGPYTEMWDGVKIIRVPIVTRGSRKDLRFMLNYFSFAFMGTLTGFLRLKREYDVFFVYQTSPVFMGVPAVLLKFLHRKPVYFWVQDVWPDTLVSLGIIQEGSWGHRILSGIIDWIYSRCDRILVPSRRIEEKLKKKKVGMDKVTFFPNWAEDIFLETPSGADNNSLNTNTDFFPEQGFSVLFTGNIGIAQSFDTILDAAEILKRHKDIFFIIVGDGHLRNYVQEEAQKRGLADNFILPGAFPLDHMPDFYSKADALLVSLKKDPLFEITIPSKVQTYMASGRPVVAALDGEGAEIIEKEAQCGLAAGSDNPQALATCILKLKDLSPEDREQLGKNGRDYYLNHFEKRKLLKQFESMESI